MQFNERAISSNREDWGLMQIRARYYGAPAQQLLNGEHNIKVGSFVINKSIEYCRKHLHREPITEEWLSIYQGSGKCKPTKLSKQVVDYANCLAEATRQDAQNTGALNCRDIYYGKVNKSL